MGILKTLQDEQRPWVKHNFGDRPAWQPLLGAVEEIGELAHAHLKHEQNIRTNESHIENAKDAVADAIIYLSDYCSAMGFDLETLVVETWNKVKQRDWKKYPEHGIDTTKHYKCKGCGSKTVKPEWGNDETGKFHYRNGIYCGPVELIKRKVKKS